MEYDEEGHVKTHNVFVGDLNPDVLEDDLISTFGACGAIYSCHIVRDKQTGYHKGYGFIHFKARDAQQRALSPEFNHIMIKVNPILLKCKSMVDLCAYREDLVEYVQQRKRLHCLWAISL